MTKPRFGGALCLPMAEVPARWCEAGSLRKSRLPPPGSRIHFRSVWTPKQVGGAALRSTFTCTLADQKAGPVARSDSSERYDVAPGG